MPSLLNLAPGAVGRPRPPLIFAQVDLHQPPPTSFNSPLYVSIPGWHQDYYKIIPPERWSADHGNTLPAPGAAVLLAEVPEQTSWGLWVIAWEGTHS